MWFPRYYFAGILLAQLSLCLADFKKFRLALITKPDSGPRTIFGLDTSNKLWCVEVNLEKKNGAQPSDCDEFIKKLLFPNETSFDVDIHYKNLEKQYLRNSQFATKYHEEKTYYFYPHYEYALKIDSAMVHFYGLIRLYKCLDGGKVSSEKLSIGSIEEISDTSEEEFLKKSKIDDRTLIFFKDFPILECSNKLFRSFTAFDKEPDVEHKELVVHVAFESDKPLIVDSSGHKLVTFSTKKSTLSIDLKTCEIADEKIKDKTLIHVLKGEFRKVYSRDLKTRILFLIASCHQGHGGMLITPSLNSLNYFDAATGSQIIQTEDVYIKIEKHLQMSLEHATVLPEGDVSEKLNEVYIQNEI